MGTVKSFAVRNMDRAERLKNVTRALSALTMPTHLACEGCLSR